jgi:toxin ParE1/3/4
MSGICRPTTESGSRPPELKRSRYRQIVEPPCRVFYRYDGVRIYILYVMRSEQLLRPSRVAAREKVKTPAPKKRA